MNRMMKSFRVVAPLLLMGVAACDQSTPAEPSNQMSPALSAQHAANLRAIEQERAASAARYDGLVTQWKSRQGGGPFTAATSTSATFLACAPLPFDGAAQVVGAAGGVFYFGPHKLTVPAGALSANVSIAVMVPSSLKNEVTLLPHGTQFAAPVKLRLAYGNCDAAASHRVAYIDSLSNVLEWTSSFDYSTAGFVEASLQHFSQYAIAY